MKVIFVGISNKSSKNGELSPLEENTASGKIIALVENRLGQEFLKTNLVLFVPLDEFGKIRHPSQEEIKAALPNCLLFINSNSPCLVFLLGKIVQKAFLDNLEIEKINPDLWQLGENVFLAPIHHPAYIHTYKKGSLGQYVAEIEAKISQLNREIKS